MVVGGRHIGGSGGGGGNDDGGGTRGRRSRANSPLVPPNGVLTPAGSQNMNSPSASQCSKLNDSLSPASKGGDSNKPSDALLKSAESMKTASGTLGGGGGGGGVRRSLSPVPHSHHAPPIDPDLRSKNNSGDHLHIGSSPSASGISHHASHHLLPPSTPHHHHHHHGPDSDSDAESDSGMRIGDDYQAVIPEFDPDFKPDSSHDAMLVWAPKPDLNEQKLDDYVTLAKEKYGYNAEQALGMLFWHKYNVDRAMIDLANFTPYPDDWSVEDKVLFEQAFSFHGKVFHRIRQMLPDKSIGSLVKYYYSWKKTRFRTSVMDRQARKLQAGVAEEVDRLVDENANAEDADMPEVMEMGEKIEGAVGPSTLKSICSNCSVTTGHLSTTSKGSQLCSICYSYWRRTGLMRCTIGPSRRPAHGHGSAAHRDDSGLFNKGAAKPNPPKDMNLEQGDLDLFTVGPPPCLPSSSTPGSSCPVSAEVQTAASPVVNPTSSSQMSGPSAVAVASETLQGSGIVEGLDSLLSASASTDATFTALSRITMRWSNEELLLAVQGVRQYGQDFKAIAEVLGTKSESQVRSFYTNYKRRYHLDDVYAEFLTASAAKKRKRSSEGEDRRVTTPISSSSSSSHGGGGEEPMMEGVESVVVDNASDASMTLIDLKEESNSSVDSFISAADAAELNEKMAAKAEQDKLKKTTTTMTTTTPTPIVPALADTDASVKLVGAAASATKTLITKSPSARESPPPTDSSGPTDNNTAPDTPDSSNEAMPARRSSSNGASGVAAKDMTTTTTISKAKNVTKTGSGGEVAATRPTRTSISKTVMT